MDILGTGMSNTARKQQKECAQAIKKFVETTKGKQVTFKYNVLMEEFRHQSDIVSYFVVGPTFLCFTKFKFVRVFFRLGS